eukprot:3751037-Ditylum_brightwellii.AAC.1
MAYLLLQKTRKYKSDMNAWNRRAAITRTCPNFKTEMRAAQKTLQHTGELTVQDAINQVEVVNMVAEGIQQAMKNPPTSIIDEHRKETANLAEENVHMQKKLDDMHNL